ncbi:LysR family transcriptional regulator [Paraburkholderia sp. Ac-20347]|uniref:LysR family transcriptional regulator n=1 Tax=Paraburkholderia sp. Ac-20347 TaxID=2703892 RepID=UPI00197E486A|nr:LysR family transcriptional regulator [Paraburkholderia sp. Ac-20347]MBN3807684.1 LysR family transcriptional regulator [Paraburkholderia sp. Ac-20347]
MRIALEQLETLVWVARLGSFRAAARQQHVSQPTISARIAELERILEMRIFERTRHKVEITLRGRDILERAQIILRATEELLAAGQKSDPMRGVLRLGANESTAMVCLTELLGYLREQYPTLRVELTVDVGSTLSAKLNAKELDVAILTDPHSTSAVNDVVLGEAELEWLACVKFLNGRQGLTARELRALPIVTIAPPSTLFEAAQQWFSSESLSFDNYASCNSLAMMTQLVRAGNAVAILPPTVLKTEIDNGSVAVISTSSHFVRPRFYMSYIRECESHEIRLFVESTKKILLSNKLIK